MIPIGASLWGQQACYTVVVKAADAEAVDCYSIRVPIFLFLAGQACDLYIAGAVSGRSAKITHIEPFDSGVLSSSVLGNVAFELTGSSTATAYPHDPPIFWVHVSADPGEDFEIELTELAFKKATTGGACDGDACDLGDAHSNSTLSAIVQGPSVASCASPAKVLDMDIDLDGMDILPLSHLEGQGQRAILPVKLVADAAEDLEGVRRIDFEIRFEDEYGNIEIATQDIFAPNSDFELEVAISKVMGTIRGSMIFNDVLPSIEEYAAYPGRYEAEIFRIEAEAPYDAPQGGSVTFTSNFVRAELEGEDCCLAGLLGGGEVELDEFKYPCTDTDPGAFVDIGCPADLGEQLRIRVRAPNAEGASIDQFEFDGAFIEVELFMEGSYSLNEAMTEAAGSELCPAACTQSGYPGAGCVAASAAENKVTYGFCTSSSMVPADVVLFTIFIDKGAGGSLTGIRVNRADWASALVGDCAPAVRRPAFEPLAGQAEMFCGAPGAGVPGASIRGCGGPPVVAAVTDPYGEFEAGAYYCPAAAAQGGELGLAVEKDDDIRCGLSTLDLIRMQQHILGIIPFSAPWEYIAADLNEDDNVTTLDQIFLQRIILGIGGFPGRAWKFMPEGFDLAPTGTNPFEEAGWAAISEVFDCGTYDLSEGRPAISAIKIGDVNGSCSSCAASGSASGETAARAADNTTWQDQQEGRIVVALEVPAGAGISGLQGFQAALRYDTAKLEYEGIRPKDLPYVDTSIIGHSLEEPGVLRLAWYDHSADGQSLSAGEQLLELAFLLLDSSFSPADIWLDQSLMAAEAYLGSDSSIAARHFVLETPGGGMRPAPGSTATPAGRARVYPNPSDRNFVLQVDSAKDQAGRLVVLNAAGQAIHEQAIDLPQGQASFLIEGSERWPTGIYYLQLYADGLPVFSEKLLRQ